MPDDDRYTITELADLAGVTPRTIRYYLAQGLLPAVGQPGPGAKYGSAHLARLRLTRRLQAEHLPLAEIRGRLETLDDETVRELVEAGPPAPPPDSALDYIRGVLGGSSRLAGRSSGRIVHASRTLQPPTGEWEPMAAASPSWLLARDLPASRDEPAPTAPAAPATPPPASSAAPSTITSPSLGAPDRSQWERVVLAPGIELHLRRPLTRSLNRTVDRLIAIARELLEEGSS